MSFAIRTPVREFMGGLLPLIGDSSGTRSKLQISNDEGRLSGGSGSSRPLASTAIPGDSKLFTRYNGGVSSENNWPVSPFLAASIWGHDFEVRADLIAGSYNTTDWNITTFGAWLPMTTPFSIQIRSGHTGDGTFRLQIRQAGSTVVLTTADYRLAQ